MRAADRDIFAQVCLQSVKNVVMSSRMSSKSDLPIPSDRVLIINNTGSDVRMFDAEIKKAVDSGGVLPEELADIYRLLPVVGYPNRWRLEWA